MIANRSRLLCSVGPFAVAFLVTWVSFRKDAWWSSVMLGLGVSSLMAAALLARRPDWAGGTLGISPLFNALGGAGGLAIGGSGLYLHSAPAKTITAVVGVVCWAASLLLNARARRSREIHVIRPDLLQPPPGG